MLMVNVKDILQSFTKISMTLNRSKFWSVIGCARKFPLQINFPLLSFLTQLSQGDLINDTGNWKLCGYKGITTPSVKRRVKRQRQRQHRWQVSIDLYVMLPQMLENRPQTHSQASSGAPHEYDA